MCICSAELAKSHLHDSVATFGEADKRLARCVVGSKIPVEFEDLYGTSKR